MSLRFHIALIALLLAAPAAASVRTADGSGLVLDRDAPVQKRGTQVRHLLRVDRRSIERLAGTGGPLFLPSTGPSPVPARDVRLIRRADGLTTLTARVETAAGPQSAVLTLGDGIVFGLVPQFEGAPLRLETRDGRAWVVEGGVAFVGDGDDVALPPPPTAADRLRRQRQDGAKAEGVPNVDVLVLYTPTLVSVWGSDAAMKARIAHLEAITNQAYVDSQVNQTITVVGTYLVDYVNESDNNDTLDALTRGGSIPIAQDASRLRQVHGADLVALLREFNRTHQTSCGIGWLGGWDGGAFRPDTGFSVTADHGFGEDHCGEWTFSHELGHNMGAHHDVETSGDEKGAYPYSHGFRRTLSPTSGYATVMAYTQSPQVRLGRFSNPRQSTCAGQVCGDTGTADNARGLSQAAPSVAGYFARPVAGSLPALSVDDVTVTEAHSGLQPARFTFTLSAPASAPVTFDIVTMHGTATGADYVSQSATVTIPAGQVSKTHDIAVRGDTVVERNEVFALNITAASGARIVDAQGIATIVNDEPIPSFSLADAEVAEGHSGTTLLTFTASLSAPSTSPVVFDVDITEYGIDGARVGEDYVAQAWDSLTIPAGNTSVQFSIQVIGDTVAEPDERLRLVVSGLKAAEITRDWARGWIRDDDGSGEPPAIRLVPANATEGNAGLTPMVFQAVMDGFASQAVTFQLSTAGSTAAAGSDFTAPTSGSIPAGSLSAPIEVQVHGDALDEDDEIVRLTLQSVVGATVDTSHGPASGSIFDDDGTLPLLMARDDRAVASTGYNVVSPVRNDVFTPARLAGGSLQILSSPAGSRATLEAGLDPYSPHDDQITFFPADRFLGDSIVRYRLCESTGRCTDGRITFVSRALQESGSTASATGAGRTLGEGLYFRAAASQAYVADYAITPLVAPEVATPSLAADPTPESPWDGARAGTYTQMRTIPASGTPVAWRAWAYLAAMDGLEFDVYLGIDDDADGRADPGETRCVGNATSQRDTCELSLDVPAGTAAAYWVVVHNRGPAGQPRLEMFDVPLIGSDGSTTISGAGLPDTQQYTPIWISWSDPTLLPGDSRVAFAGARAFPGQPLSWSAIRIVRGTGESAAIPLASGEPLSLALAAGAAQDRLFIDVPVGATRLVVGTASDQDIDLYLSHANVAAGTPTIAAAPARGAAQASATGPSGNEAITINGPASGRWYITPVNGDALPARLSVTATIAAPAQVVRPGSYFNPSRSGHGLLLYPAADDWAGLWYTYFDDGSATWYYLQGPKPGADGVWEGGLYRAMWDGDSHQQTRLGRAFVTPTGPDAFRFTWTMEGESGSEPMQALGRGCPTLGGSPLDVSSHWFSPATAGTGHSVQMFPNYEFYASFVYDRFGIPRFLTAESGVFAGATANLPLQQLSGFCPLCARNAAPSRQTIGTLTRSFSGGTFTSLALEGTFAHPAAGPWSRSEPVQTLGGPGTTQGCAP